MIKIKKRSKNVMSGLTFTLVIFLAPIVTAATSETVDKPNILFFVMDDVGVDQMQLYGYGDPGVETRNNKGDRHTRTPNIDAIAANGVTFRSAWAMPDCSPSRATFFTGRLPSRTGVFNPIQPTDLAQSQVSPYEQTLPKILKTRGYVSGLIGKMHLSGNEQFPKNNPLLNETYRELGFDYFNGYLDAAPLSIDNQAGLKNVAAGTYSCGFIPNTTTDAVHGADSGTCFYADGESKEMNTENFPTPGRACLESGGIFEPSGDKTNIDFSRDNGYYTGRWVENLEDGVTTYSHLPSDTTVDPAQYRGYRSIVEANRAITWIKEKQQSDQPWMLSVGFSSAHTPWHNVPASILPADSVNTDDYKCTDNFPNKHPDQMRVLQQQMLEGLDHELGRILVDTGIASYNSDGSLNYDPASSNTLIVIIGDNGTFGPAVNAPFDASRAKGFPYQTGVWVPLIAAGPMVKSPGRIENALVNGMDLFKLFSQVAHINANSAVPNTHQIDAEEMLNYLTNPKSQPIRKTNLTQTGENLRVLELTYYTPCVLLEPYNAVTNFFPRRDICEKNGGTWYGAGSSVDGVPDSGLADGCAVNDFRAAHGMSTLLLDSPQKIAIRDENYKLVELDYPDCNTGNPPETPRETTMTFEFYRIDDSGPEPLIDTEENNLLKDGRMLQDLTSNEKLAFIRLAMGLTRWKKTVAPSCPGDGNQDLVVDDKDIEDYYWFADPENGGTGLGYSSWFDFNLDGFTNTEDLEIIQSHFGQRCIQDEAASNVSFKMLKNLIIDSVNVQDNK